MILLEYAADQHFIYLKNPPFHMKNQIKEHLNGIWFDNKKGKGWKLPKNVHVYRELYKFFPELQNHEKFIEDGKQLKRITDYILTLKSVAHVDDERLRLYQCMDVGYLLRKGSALILNEPRTGKTPTIITTLKHLKTKKNLVVCPSSLVFNWSKEFTAWFPEIKIYTVSGSPKQRKEMYEEFSNNKKPRVLIVSKDTFKRDTELQEMKYDVAVVDEAHFLRNYKSAQSKAIFQIDAKIKYPLTGTPAVKHGVDVFGLLHFIEPKLFPSYWHFAERYFHINDGHWGKSIEEPKGWRQDELRTIMAINSVQRKRSEVMQWLPKTQYQTIPLQMEGKQLKLYDQLADTFMATDEGHEIDTMNKLTQLLRLRQLQLDPRLLGFDTPGIKTKALLEFAEDNTEPFIVMTTFSSYFKLIKPELEKLGKKVGIIDGSISKEQKARTAEDFQKGRYDILLCNIIAAGTGFTLDRADTIVFLDKDFNPADNIQAEDRIIPTTKERYHNVNVISLVCAGSIDERVNEILDNKEDLTKLINKPELFAH